MNRALIFASMMISFAAIHVSPLFAAPMIDEPVKTPISTPSEVEVASRFTAIKGEYDAEMARFREAADKLTDQTGMNKLFQTMYPDDVAYSRKMVDLALTAPKTIAARDAALWVIDHPGRSEEGPFGDEYGRAVGILIRHHGDDPEAVRIGLRLDNTCSSQRDTLLYGFVAAAKGRESMGMARLSLAQYLVSKAKYAQGTRNIKARLKFKVKVAEGEGGKLVEKEIEESVDRYAYQLALRESNPDSLLYEAERLYQEVIADYADVPHVTIVIRRLEAAMKMSPPSMNGKPLTENEQRQIAEILGRKTTLAQVAEARLDDMRNLVVGKPAPEIDGVDFDGKPLKLSDFRGKVVALVFWGTWCGPCMAEVPHERELVERMKGKPFVMLGVNCDEDKSAAVKVMTSERITWPNWHDGAPDTGPITKRYHIRGYPTVIVVDAEGIIRARDLRGEGIDKAVETCLESIKPAEPVRP